MSFISNLCTFWVMTCMFTAPIMLMIFFILLIKKDNRKKFFGISALCLAGAVILFSFLGAYTDPATYCEHQWEITENVESTCTDKGYTTKHCPLCDKTTTEYKDKKDHTMVTIENSDEIINKCSVCGYEKVEKNNKDTTPETTTRSSDKKNSKDSSAETTTRSSDKKKNEVTTAKTSSYSKEFINACNDINIDVSKITNWEQKDDWANGKRYGFSYKGSYFVAYINYDGSIKSINLRNTHIYEKNYEPYDVEDYLVDASVATSLIPYAEDTVKLTLNYPATAKFPLFGWAYGREKNLYQLSNTLTAKNGFGVKEEISFTVIFDIGTGNSAKCVYLSVNGSVVKSNMPEKTERKKISEEKDIPSNPNEIRLIDGQLGKYGKTDKKYPEYIDYYVPVGKYTVKGNAKNSIVMIIDDLNNNEIKRLELSNGQQGEIEIKKNQHIELSMYSDVTLIKKS